MKEKNFKVVSGSSMIKGLEIVREGEFNGFKMTDKVMKGFIKKFKLDKRKLSYRPTVFVGHNGFFSGEEKPAVAFIDNIYMEGKKMLADLKGNTKDFLDKLQEFPYRSIEFTEDRLWGLALLGSNAPAVKTEATAFNEEGKKHYLSNPINQSITLSNNNPNMENFKKFLEEISSKDVITKEDLQKLQKDFDALSEEEQLETVEEVNAVEEKAEEAGVILDVEGTDPVEPIEPIEPVEPIEPIEPIVPIEPIEPVVPADPEVQLSEGQQIVTLQEKVKADQKELSQLRTELRKGELKSDVAKYILSEENPVGLPKEFSEKAIDFCANLSKEQTTAFFEIIGNFKSVDFKEEGDAGNGANTVSDKDDAFDTAATKYAEENGVDYSEALKIVTSK